MINPGCQAEAVWGSWALWFSGWVHWAPRPASPNRAQMFKENWKTSLDLLYVPVYTNPCSDLEFPGTREIPKA